MSATHGMWECEHGVDGRDHCDQCHAPAPLNLYAINAELAGAGCLRPRTAAALLARLAQILGEVERLRAESGFARLLGPARMVLDRCAVALIGMEEGMEAEQMAQQIVDLIGHPVTDEPPHALVELERLRAENERLRATKVSLNSTLDSYRSILSVRDKKLKALRADSVPRSALVQVGWDCGVTHRPDETGRGTVTGSLAFIEEDRCCDQYQPVYVIRGQG